MPRFVILEHDHPTLHWDFMLEDGLVLKTWRLPAPPPADPRVAQPLEDHRNAYLDYEGPVAGNRGAVKRWDIGTFDWTEHTHDLCRLELHGARWNGIVTLRKLDDAVWNVRFETA